METSLIFPAMVAIMKDVEAIKKEKTNTQGAGFKYRGVDDAYNSLHGSFAKNGVFIMHDVLERKETERVSKQGGALFYVTLTIRFAFYAGDGSFVTSTVSGTAMDSGDKADNKCMSIAAKYCLLIAFLIPTEDMPDPDAQTHEVKAKEPVIIPKPEPVGPVPMTEKVWVKYVARMQGGEKGLPEKIRKAFILNSTQDKTLKVFETIPIEPTFDMIIDEPIKSQT
jgi:hypothetical protein